MGIRKASLYHHFPQKDDLLYALCVDSLSRIGSAVEEAIDWQDDPIDQLLAVIGAHLRATLADQDMHATMLSELRSINPARITEVVALRNAYETLVHDVIREAQAGGALRSYISSRQLTLALLNLLNWTIFWFRFDGTMSVPELRTTLTSIFVEGAAAPAASGPPRPQRLIVRPDG